MCTIHPFRGIRPIKDLAKQIASPPYDVINSEEARKYAAGNPYSFLHIVKPEIDLPEDIVLYDDRVYAKAKENLLSFIENGWLIQDKEPSFYIYSQQMGEHIQTGLVACISAKEYDKNIIKKHELTRKDKEEDRTRHVIECNANTGPVFITYKENNKVKELIEIYQRKTSPEYNFSVEGVEHTFWHIKERATINKLINLFKKIPYLYIADGHHRSASGAIAAKRLRDKNPNHTGNEEYNFYLAVLFPDTELQILSYNRALKTLNNNQPADILEKLKEKFEISETMKAYSPEDLHFFGMYLDGKWYKLKAMDKIFDAKDIIGSLDVSILQEQVLEPIFGIINPREDKNIDFIGGIRGLKELEKLVNNGTHKIAFSMYPTTVEQLISIADAGKIMPPKSTWFEPKLRSGLIIHSY